MKFFLSLLILIASVRSFAVSSVGRGGAMPELQFIYYFHHTDRVIELCLKDAANSCALSEPQRDAWTRLVADLTKPSSKFKNDVEIAFTSQGDQLFNVQGNILTLNTKALYTPQGLPLSDSQILANAVSVQQMWFLPTAFSNASEVFSKNQQSLRGLRFERKSTLLQVAQNDFQFHRLSIEINGSQLQLFALEDKFNSYSLNDLIQKSAPQFDVAVLLLQQVRASFFQDTLLFYGGFNEKAFELSARLDPQNPQLLDPNTFQFKVSLH